MAHTGNVRSRDVSRLNGHGHAPPRAAKKTKKTKREYLYAKGPIESMRTLLQRARVRLAKQASRAKAYGLPANLYIVENIDAAIDALVEVDNGLTRVPEGWKPLRGSLGGHALIVEGATVTIRADKRKGRIDLDDPSVLLQAERIVGGKVRCIVIGDGPDKGTRVVIPRVHLQPIKEMT